MKVLVGDLMLASRLIQRLFELDPEHFDDKLRLVQIRRALGEQQEMIGKLQQELFDTYATPHPEEEGIYLFAQTDDEGEPIPNPDYDPEDPESAQWLRDEEAIEGYRDELARMQHESFNLHTFLNGAWVEENWRELKTNEMDALDFLIEEMHPLYEERREAEMERWEEED